MKRVFMAAAMAGAALLSAPVAAADTNGFTSPSGNIACMLTDDLLRCDIKDRDWSPPPRPADCSEMTGYGQGIRIQSTGPASFVCGGDTTFGGAGSVLSYGEYAAGGGMSCNSELSGMRCSNSDGHGFTLSKQAYTLF